MDHSGSPSASWENQDALGRLFDAMLGSASGYNKKLRPLPDCSAHDCSHRIQVKLGIQFTKLLEVDEKRNRLLMLAVLTMTWPDHRLAYKSQDYFPQIFSWDSEEDFIPMDPELLWHPDIQLVNAAEPIEPLFNPRAYVYDNEKRLKEGFNVRTRLPAVLSVKCNLNLDDFPFDHHSCPFVFRAWSANAKWIDFASYTPPHMTTGTGDSDAEEEAALAEKLGKEYHKDKTGESTALSDKNEGFDITKVEVKDSVISNDELGDGKEAFPQVTYTVHLTRFSHYYVASVILPMSMLVLLSGGAFYIDPERGERLGYNVTLILTVMSVSFFTAERLPKTGGGDTWLERFQAFCYIFALFPLVISLALELARRKILKFHKRDLDADEAGTGSFIDTYVDRCLRFPYAVCITLFQVHVFMSCHSWAEVEEGVLLMQSFILLVTGAMLLYTAWELVMNVRRGMFRLEDGDDASSEAKASSSK